MTRRFIAAAMLVALVLAGGLVAAQTQTAAPAPSKVDAAIEQLRKDTRAEVTDIIAGTMGFSADEASKFWPLYRKYEEAQKAVGDEKVTLIKDYAANYQSMTDQKAQVLLSRLTAVEDKGLAAKRQFISELQKVLPAKRVAKYYQVDNRINLLMNLALAEQIPLVE